MDALLEGQQLSKWFGGVRALENVDFHLGRGEILGLIGPNGAGKTTLINVISGSVRGSSGHVLWKGRPIGRLPAQEVAGLGIARSFQISRAFLGMTVEENILVGALFGSATLPRGRERRLRRVDEILEFLGLTARRSHRVQTLNVPDRKRVDLGRALAMQPEVLMLDELMAGLNPTDMDTMMTLVREINRGGISLIVIEHVMKVIVDLSHRVMVLHHGQKIAEGPAEAVMHDPLVTEAYLGPKFRDKVHATTRERPATTGGAHGP